MVTRVPLPSSLAPHKAAAATTEHYELARDRRKPSRKVSMFYERHLLYAESVPTEDDKKSHNDWRVCSVLAAQ